MICMVSRGSHHSKAVLQLSGSYFEGKVGDAARSPAGCIGGMQLVPDGVSIDLWGPGSGLHHSVPSLGARAQRGGTHPRAGDQGDGRGAKWRAGQCGEPTRQEGLYGL